VEGEYLMTHPPLQIGLKITLGLDDLEALITLLRKRGYTVLGPVASNGAIIFDAVTSILNLPAGWTDEQDKGFYRLRERADGALFGYSAGPHSLKNILHPSDAVLRQTERDATGFRFLPARHQDRKTAFIGVRPCDLHALAILDKVLLEGPYIDACYRSRRDPAFFVAVNCIQPGATCFCTSMGGGPKAAKGFDLALTEVILGDRHYFVAEIGSGPGGEVLGEIVRRESSVEEVEHAERLVREAAGRMGRSMDASGVKELLYSSVEHPHWDRIASRCLACGNCTMVCPTCFCTTIEDFTDLTGARAERRQRWDSCFTAEFSYIHGGTIRSSIASRYRQWMVHKLATWVDQYGELGCVGCGRCIAWCPAGIDITEEVRVFAESKGAS
jgi:ferredoxin